MSVVIQSNLSALDAAIVAHERAQRLSELLTMPGVVEGMMECLSYYDRFLSEVYPITINYGNPQSDEDRVAIFVNMVAAGRYDYVNPNITPANFTLSGTGIVEAEICLFHFGRDMPSDPVIAEMPKFWFEPPLIEHCLEFGAQHPEVQRQFPIVFLGSSCLVSGYRRVPCLGRGNSRRSLHLSCFDGIWRVSCMFAAVRTKKQK